MVIALNEAHSAKPHIRNATKPPDPGGNGAATAGGAATGGAAGGAAGGTAADEDSEGPPALNSGSDSDDSEGPPDLLGLNSAANRLQMEKAQAISDELAAEKAAAKKAAERPRTPTPPKPTSAMVQQVADETGESRKKFCRGHTMRKQYS